MIEIPLNSSPEQLFSITLDGTPYDLRVALNSRTGVWSVSFSKEGLCVIAGVPILGGVDMVRQHNLPIKNLLTVNLDNPAKDASKDNLGIVARLYMLTDEEVSGG